MLAILSPAKNFNNTTIHSTPLSIPVFKNEANKIINELRLLSVDELSELYKASKTIAHTNFIRFQNWIENPRKERLLTSLHAFVGEAYRGLNASIFTDDQMVEADKIIRILSGMYGILKPLDGIQPYRLEIGTQWGGNGYKNLYERWSETVTNELNKSIHNSPGDKILVNLASNEYFKVINRKLLKYPVLMIEFKEELNGQLKTVVVYAKKARGMMVRYMVENNLRNKDDLKGFNLDGYCFSNEYSIDRNWVFYR